MCVHACVCMRVCVCVCVCVRVLGHLWGASSNEARGKEKTSNKQWKETVKMLFHNQVLSIGLEKYLSLWSSMYGNRNGNSCWRLWRIVHCPLYKYFNICVLPLAVYKTVFFILTMQTTEKCLQTSGLNHKDVVLSGQYFTFLLALQTFCLAPPKKNSR